MKKAMMSLMGVLATGSLFANLPDPVIWWTMDAIDEAGGVRVVRDASGNGRDLTVGADCVLSDDAVAGKALAYQGTTDSTGVFNSPALRSRTVSLWFYRAESDGPLGPEVNALPYLLASVSGFNAQMSYNNEDAIVFMSGSHHVKFDNMPAFLRSRWRHYAFVVEDTGTVDGDGRSLCNVRTYLNGKPYSFALAVPMLTSLESESEAYLGNIYTGTRPVNGRIDDVRVYDVALTDAQAAEEFARVGYRRPALCLGRWNMDRVETDADGRCVPGENGTPCLRIRDDNVLVSGVDGQALTFVNTTGSLASLTTARSFVDFSLSAWVNLSSAQGIAPRLVTGSPGMLLISGGDRSLATTWWASAQTSVSTSQPLFDVWSHYVITTTFLPDPVTGVPKMRLTTYLDGEKLAESGLLEANNLAVCTAGSTLRIGNEDVGTRAMVGLVDDLGLYADCLTDDEVKALFRGAARVSAESPVVTTRDAVRLNGFVASGSGGAGRSGYAGEIAWTQMSGPSATVTMSGNADALVTLPVAGDYVFRLSSSIAGEVKTADVQVRRIAPVAGNEPPAIASAQAGDAVANLGTALCVEATDSDQGPSTLRVTWSKVSGPGAVWFEPAYGPSTKAVFSAAGDYVVRATADDGQDAVTRDVPVTVTDGSIDLESGLLAYWDFDGKQGVNTEAKSGTEVTFPGGETRNVPSLSNRGIESYGAVNRYANTGVGPGETNRGDGMSSEQWRSFSCWIYHDPNFTIETKKAVVFYSSFRFGLWYECEPYGNGGFTLFTDWGNREICFPKPAVSPVGRWVHVYALFDRWQTSMTTSEQKSELWIDGVRQTPESGYFWGGAASTSGIVVGGMARDPSYLNTPIGYYTKDGTAEGELLSRVFPGVIDELRMYNRKLTEAEIKYLAANPSVANRAPQADVPVTVKIANKDTTSVVATYQDDGIPTAGPVTCTWRVVSGNPEGLVLTGADTASCTVTARKAGDYALQLTVSDGERTSVSAPVSLTVKPLGLAIILR